MTTTPMLLPMQAAPIQRGIQGATRTDSGVEAAGIFDDIIGGISKVGDVVGKVAGIAGPLLGSFGI